MKWKKIGKTTTPECETIIYQPEISPVLNSELAITIESRKKHIPHAGGKTGTWDHTTYFVLRKGKEVIEKYSLKDAKEEAERIIEET